jgi:hypothetical protein
MSYKPTVIIGKPVSGKSLLLRHFVSAERNSIHRESFVSVIVVIKEKQHFTKSYYANLIACDLPSSAGIHFSVTTEDLLLKGLWDERADGIYVYIPEVDSFTQNEIKSIRSTIDAFNSGTKKVLNLFAVSQTNRFNEWHKCFSDAKWIMTSIENETCVDEITKTLGVNLSSAQKKKILRRCLEKTADTISIHLTVIENKKVSESTYSLTSSITERRPKFLGIF